MPKDKERTVNPATAALKASKARDIKKSRAAHQQQRTEKLARRNPERMQRQIDELVSMREAQGGKLRPKDTQVLEGLEKDLKGVKKAREMLGQGGEQERTGGQGHRTNDARDGQQQGQRGQPQSQLGKRSRPHRHQNDNMSDSSSDMTDPDVRSIPMPQDSPPPVPPRHIRQRERDIRRGRYTSRGPTRATGANADGENLDKDAGNTPHALPTRPPPPASAPKTTYSSAPQIRDLRKEATEKFVPAAVKARQNQKSKGDQGTLPEPEELDERERRSSGRAQVSNKIDTEMPDLEEEELVFEREMREIGDDEASEHEQASLGTGDAISEKHSDKGESSHHNKVPHTVEIEEVVDEDM
ncbi:MAG: hypothetical protein M1831_004572 [Alyxoria varia]|nr:MAG: hypothetical protein M1831_004572 [Alyxoria varia]